LLFFLLSGVLNRRVEVGGGWRGGGDRAKNQQPIFRQTTGSPLFLFALTGRWQVVFRLGHEKILLLPARKARNNAEKPNHTTLKYWWRHSTSLCTTCNWNAELA
jgi:hypothetical protein